MGWGKRENRRKQVRTLLPHREGILGCGESGEDLDKLVRKGDSIDLTLSYSRGPFREAYYVHSVSRAEPRRGAYRSPTRMIELPYQHGARGGY